MIEYKIRPEDVYVAGDDDNSAGWRHGWRFEYRDARGKWHHFVVTLSVTLAGAPSAAFTVQAIHEHAAQIAGVKVEP